MSTNDDKSEDIGELLKDNSLEEVKGIVEIANDHGLELEEAKEVKELAEELDIDIDDAAELHDIL